jgi:two-component system response regulator EvgA
MFNILIVDDHPAIRLAVRHTLENNNFNVIADTSNGQDAIKLAQQHRPDVVIMDIGIPKLDGLTVTSRLTSLGLKCKVLILTSQPAESFCFRCIQAGAKAFINKEEDLSNIVTAIKAIMSGYTLFPISMQHTINHKTTQKTSEQELIKTLSDREIIVLKYLSLGYSNKSIGEMLFLSNKTVSTYKARLNQKLGLKSVIELADFSRRNALISELH